MKNKSRKIFIIFALLFLSEIWKTTMKSINIHKLNNLFQHYEHTNTFMHYVCNCTIQKREYHILLQNETSNKTRQISKPP